MDLAQPWGALSLQTTVFNPLPFLSALLSREEGQLAGLNHSPSLSCLSDICSLPRFSGNTL